MSQLVIIGEAWGKDEEQMESPFVGAAGQELYRMLGETGFPCESLPRNFISSYSMARRWKSFPFPLLNVFNCRPPDPEHKNRAEFFYSSPKNGALLDKTLPPRRIGQSKMFVLAEYAHHVHALRARLAELKPNLILALGNTALWALGLDPAIGKMRGNVVESEWGKVLPIYHPAAILRNWSLRTVTLLDLLKTQREKEYPEIHVKARYIWTEPTLNDLDAWWNRYGKNAPVLAVDIETLRSKQISEISFAASSTQALHVPFVIEERKGNKCTYRNWWPTQKAEVTAWQFVKMVCESDIPKIGQNVVQYDAYWLWHAMGIKLRNIVEDTMVKAHAWEPELEKSLGFLGSIFLDERSWKGIRKHTRKGD